MCVVCLCFESLEDGSHRLQNRWALEERGINRKKEFDQKDVLKF